MKAELESTHPNLDIEIFAINKPGTSTGIQSFNASLNLPMIQDDSAVGIWNDWGAAWRDVYILDENNELVLVYNLTTYNLSNTSDYNTLMQHFIDAATP